MGFSITDTKAQTNFLANPIEYTSLSLKYGQKLRPLVALYKELSFWKVPLQKQATKEALIVQKKIHREAIQCRKKTPGDIGYTLGFLVA